MSSETGPESWEPEDGLDVENINPEIPRELWDKFTWKAVRAAIEVADTKREVFRLMKLWNKHNDPQLPEAELIRKTQWCLDNWNTKFS